jgi:hypothetical protein
MRANETLVAAIAAVDHLLVGVSDLDFGIDWFEKMTGVKAADGGSHPGVGTRNALVSLGKKQYLELIAPDPRQTNYSFPIDVRALREPRFITWAAAADDINARAKTARDAGYQIFGPVDGSRAQPDGRLLRWKSMRVANAFGTKELQPIPFFIEWAASSEHPSEDSPKGCELRSFGIEHPDPQGVSDALKKLGIEAGVNKATEARLIATLSTPRGSVELH